MPRSYILRHRTFGETFFAGFKTGTGVGVYRPVFVRPETDSHVHVSLIHEDDIAETQAALAKFGIETDRVQVG